MQKKVVVFNFFIMMALVFTACNPEDEYLRQVYSKSQRKWAIQGLRSIKDEIVNKDKVCEKLLNLDKTPDAGLGIEAAGRIGCDDDKWIKRLEEIAEPCFKTLSVHNLNTLKSIARAIGMMEAEKGIDLLERYFSIETPEQLATGQREKHESVVKQLAIESLSEMPEASKHLVPKILEVFTSDKEDFGTKHNTAKVLGEFQAPASVGPLVDAMYYEEQGYSLFRPARESLIKLGKYAEDKLIEVYKGNNPKVNKIMDENKERALKKFCPEFVDKADNEKELQKCEAYHKYKATEAQIEATKMIKPATVLADIRSQKAVDMLQKTLEEQLATDKKMPFLVEHLSVHLAKIGDFKATSTLRKMIDKDFILQDQSKQQRGMSRKQKELAKRGQEVSVRMRGARALAILGDMSAVPSLEKAAFSDVPSALDMENLRHYFYETKIWASRAYTKMLSDKEKAEKFIKMAEKSIETWQSRFDEINKDAKKIVDEKYSKASEKPEKEVLEKELETQAKRHPMYDSTKRAIRYMKRAIIRAETAKKCGKDVKCYAEILDNDKAKDAEVEKAVNMIAYNNKMGDFADKLKKVFYHEEPFVRESLADAMLKTEDKKFIPILREALDKEGDKVEYAKAMQEFRAILSYMESL